MSQETETPRKPYKLSGPCSAGMGIHFAGATRMLVVISCVCLTLDALGGATNALAQDADGDILKRPNWHQGRLRVDDLTRLYQIYVPAGLPESAPVLLVLHGGQQSMRVIFSARARATREWVHLADREKFLIVAPNGTSSATRSPDGDRQGWNDGRMVPSAKNHDVNDVEFLGKLLDTVGKAYAVDPDRIYVAGASNGGMMVYRLLSETPERFAAGAAFIANLPVSSRPYPQPARPTPLVIINGTKDRIVKWEGGEILSGFGHVLSTDETVKWWVQANRAGDAVSQYLPGASPADGCAVRKTTYPASEGGAPVILYALEGRGHAMPTKIPRDSSGQGCHNVEGAQLAWEFLKEYRRPTPQP